MKNDTKFKKGHKHSPETIEKIRQSKLKNPNRYWLGKKRSKETNEKISVKLQGRKLSYETRIKMSFAQSGEKHSQWIKDRTKLSKKQERNDVAYKEWRKQVWARDKWKCRISDQNCSGRIEAHHILGWTKYPELRYEINNGITLCHAHHPFKKADEAKLSSFFQSLVAEMN